MQVLRSRSRLPPAVQGAVRGITRRLAVHGHVTVGRSARIGRGVTIYGPHRLELGDWVSVGPHTTIQADGSIGDFALIGMHVQIVGRADHAIDELGSPMALSTWVTERSQRPEDVVTIGRDVWIGGRATVLGGVRVREGAIVGAAAVVTRDIPPFAIAVGNPARVVGYRFADEGQREQHCRDLDLLSARLRDAS